MQTTQTQENWRALKEIAVAFFGGIHSEQPEWSVEQLFAAKGLPTTALLCELADNAGFKHESDPTASEICDVLKEHASGVHSSEAISANTGIRLQKVQRVLESRSEGYGNAPYGNAPYGSNRAVSDGKASVSRRITIKGQLSYRGQRYSLGVLYRGRTVFIRERERELLITCNDRAPLYLSRYPIT